MTTLVAFPDDLEGFSNACKTQITPSQFASIVIGFTPIDMYRDTMDLIAGEDVLTGGKINRWILAGLIVTPEIIDTAVKAGAKNADEIIAFIKASNDSISRAITVLKNSLTTMSNSIRDGEIMLKTATGSIYRPQKIAMAIDITDPNNVLKHTYGFNRVWDYNPSIGDGIIDASGVPSSQLKSMYTEHNLDTLYKDQFIDDLFTQHPEHFATLGFSKESVKIEMRKLRQMLQNAKIEASLKSTFTAPDGTPSFELGWSIENCAEV